MNKSHQQDVENISAASSSPPPSPSPSVDSCEDSDDLTPDHINVLYATVTGTAQDAAERFGRAARRRRWYCRVRDVADLQGDWSIILGPEPVIIFVATTGNGAFPPSLIPLWKFLLQSSLPHDIASDLPFAIFGLGDSSYPKFNWPAKKLHNRLCQLGAIPFLPRGDGDDQDYLGLDTALTPWLESAWPALDEILPRPPGQDIPFEECPPPRLKLVPAPQDTLQNNQHNTSKEDQVTCLAQSNYTAQDYHNKNLVATLVRNERTTDPQHFQDTRIVDFKFSEPVHYKPGDVLTLRPSNPTEDVEQMIKLLKWQDVADKPYYIQTVSPDEPMPKHFPSQNVPTTLRHLLTHHLDAFSVPKRSFFEWLSYFTDNNNESEEKDKCLEFCSSEGQEDFYDYATRPKRTMYEVLTEFKSARIPPEYIADVFPEMRPRQFSIASSCKEDNKLVRLLVAIVKYKTIIRKPRRGVCTHWLSNLNPGVKIRTALENGTMQPPPLASTPVILIGPGTGIAPFRSFVEERAIQGGKENMVFFGCRSRKADYYFEDDWNELANKGSVSIHVAASRDQESKIYVQHLLKEQSDQIWDYIQRGAYIYISGSANAMPKAVRKALVETAIKNAWTTDDGKDNDLEKDGNGNRRMNKQEAEEWLESLESCQRLQEETWS